MITVPSHQETILVPGLFNLIPFLIKKGFDEELRPTRLQGGKVPRVAEKFAQKIPSGAELKVRHPASTQYPLKSESKTLPFLEPGLVGQKGQSDKH